MMKKMFHRENNLSNLNKCKEYSLMVNQLFLGPKRRISSFFTDLNVGIYIQHLPTIDMHGKNQKHLKLIHFIRV